MWLYEVLLVQKCGKEYIILVYGIDRMSHVDVKMAIELFPKIQNWNNIRRPIRNVDLIGIHRPSLIPMHLRTIGKLCLMSSKLWTGFLLEMLLY